METFMADLDSDGSTNVETTDFNFWRMGEIMSS